MSDHHAQRPNKKLLINTKLRNGYDYVTLFEYLLNSAQYEL